MTSPSPDTHDERYNPLVFLHLSDIHFTKGASTQAFDLDEDVRRQLESDAAKVVEQIGNVNAILVTGDIAFSGASDEYLQAKDWLSRMSGIVKCEPQIVLTVPGNHDVDQSYYNNDAILRATLDSVTACRSDGELNSKLYQIYGSPRSESILYEPIKNYNLFAAELGCELSHLNQTWSRDFILESGVVVHVRGLNSVLGSRRGDEIMSNLFLGLRQLQIPETPKTLNLTLCHHPPEWLKDYDQTHDYLSGRVHVQLFGHKHRQSVDTINDRLRITAGAVHPNRMEDGWLPRYNFIKISVESETLVKITVYPRVWRDTRFEAEYGTDGKEYIEKILEFGGGNLNVIANSQKPEEPITPTLVISDESEQLINETSIIVDEENTMGTSGIEYGRILVRRFLNLNEYSQDKIIQELELNMPPFGEISVAETVKEIFVRAKDRKQLKALWEEVEKEHGDNMFSENPFPGD